MESSRDSDIKKRQEPAQSLKPKQHLAVFAIIAKTDPVRMKMSSRLKGVRAAAVERRRMKEQGWKDKINTARARRHTSEVTGTGLPSITVMDRR